MSHKRVNALLILIVYTNTNYKRIAYHCYPLLLHIVTFLAKQEHSHTVDLKEVTALVDAYNSTMFCGDLSVKCDNNYYL